MRKFFAGLFLLLAVFNGSTLRKQTVCRFQDNADSAMVLKSLPEDKTISSAIKS
jgi:hypothetical protein